MSTSLDLDTSAASFILLNTMGGGSFEHLRTIKCQNIGCLYLCHILETLVICSHGVFSLNYICFFLFSL